ncbi:hypothetical protein KJ780_03245, partial [Candidatus Micrarchaeota archaeon]|nr:hypothetical protein [Candidatus Micrarchaeota archaeon]
VELKDGKLIINLDGKEHEFGKEDALRILDAKVADDIKIETVLELKKPELLGKEIFIEIKQGKVVRVAVKN